MTKKKPTTSTASRSTIKEEDLAFSVQVQESILNEAEAIVSGSRSTDYGDPLLSMTKVARMTEFMLDKRELSLLSDGEIPVTLVPKILMAVKLVRNSFARKRDNLVDLAGYTRILQECGGSEE